MDRSELKLKLMEYAAKGYEVPRMDMIKTPEQIEGIRKAGKVNSAVLDAVEKTAAGIVVWFFLVIHPEAEGHSRLPEL